MIRSGLSSSNFCLIAACSLGSSKAATDSGFPTSSALSTRSLLISLISGIAVTVLAYSRRPGMLLRSSAPSPRQKTCTSCDGERNQLRRSPLWNQKISRIMCNNVALRIDDIETDDAERSGRVGGYRKFRVSAELRACGPDDRWRHEWLRRQCHQSRVDWIKL